MDMKRIINNSPDKAYGATHNSRTYVINPKKGEWAYVTERIPDPRGTMIDGKPLMLPRTALKKVSDKQMPNYLDIPGDLAHMFMHGIYNTHGGDLEILENTADARHKELKNTDALLAAKRTELEEIEAKLADAKALEKLADAAKSGDQEAQAKLREKADEVRAKQSHPQPTHKK